MSTTCDVQLYSSSPDAFTNTEIEYSPSSVPSAIVNAPFFEMSRKSRSDFGRLEDWRIGKTEEIRNVYFL